MDSSTETTSTRWRAAAAAIALALAAGCGGDAAGEPVLFDGPPGELLPHEAGRTSRFVVRAESGTETTSTLLTTRVLSEGPGGGFIVETTPDGGASRRLRARETDTQIRLEALAVEGPDGMRWTPIEPAAVLIETPVVRDRTLRTRLVRTIDIAATIDGVRQTRQITFVGESLRTARGWETISIAGMELSALAFDVRGQSQTVRLSGIPDSAGDGSLRLDLRGTEHVVPRIGVVREVLELTIVSGETRTRVELQTERDLTQMAADETGRF